MIRYKYPYSDFHELNLDYILKLCRESLGIGLKVVDKQLWLVNDLDEPLSKVTIHYSETALTDVDGKPIKSYIISAGVENKKLIFTNGNDEITSITVPYSIQAEEDIHGNKIDSYVKKVGVAGDKLLITFGDQSTYSFNCPFAVKAEQDVNHKELVTYAAGIETDGNEIVLTDGRGLEITRIICQYAEKAKNDVDGDEIKTTYAHTLTTDVTTVKLISKDGTQLSEITVPYATKALTDTDGNAFLSDYVESLIVDGQRIGVEAHDGKRLSTITVPFSTLSTDATNAVETVAIVGDQTVFTTYGGKSFAITSPYAVKATNDELGNNIIKTYIANVTNNTDTGEISFLDAEGEVIVSLIPTVNKATHDSYGNIIANYIKEILVDTNSNYVTVTHGTGNSESLLINYSTHAWKDTNENIIKNFYISWLECVEDVQDGHFKLVAYDGDTPRAELFRFDLKAYMAQVDVNERKITSYIGNVEADNEYIKIFNGNDEKENSISGKITTTPTGLVTTNINVEKTNVISEVTPNVPSAFIYDGTTKTLRITTGTALSSTESQVINELSAESTFTGNEAEISVIFDNGEV